MTVMEGSHRLSVEQMSSFLAASEGLEMEARTAEEVRQIVAAVLSARGYKKLPKGEKGTVRRYLMRVSGYGRGQVARLIREYGQRGELKPKFARRRKFPTALHAGRRRTAGPRRYGSSRYIGSGGATAVAARIRSVSRCRVRTAGQHFGFAHLQPASSERYRKHRAVYKPTQSTPVAIGERRCPDPKGVPGWLRVDTVHQGDPRDGKAGLYHINAADTVTQWQVIGCVETISERHLLPVLEAMMHQFPFRIHGFHSDNGSEFINYRVAEMLEKLRIEQTKSRANRTTDNALIEGKNGAVVRNYIGYGHLAAEHAEAFQRFYMAHLNPYLNFHRPCGFAEVKVNERGKRRRRYPVDQYRTPYEKLQTLPKWEKCLKKGIQPNVWLSRQLP